MESINHASGLLILIPIFIAALWILGFACLIQLFRFLTKGIKALDIYIDKGRKNNNNDLNNSQ